MKFDKLTLSAKFAVLAATFKLNPARANEITEIINESYGLFIGEYHHYLQAMFDIARNDDEAAFVAYVVGCRDGIGFTTHPDSFALPDDHLGR